MDSDKSYLLRDQEVAGSTPAYPKKHAKRTETWQADWTNQQSKNFNTKALALFTAFLLFCLLVKSSCQEPVAPMGFLLRAPFFYAKNPDYWAPSACRRGLCNSRAAGLKSPPV
jgi:hypothetical protein